MERVGSLAIGLRFDCYAILPQNGASGQASPVTLIYTALGRSWLQRTSLRLLALLNTRSPMVRPSASVITLRPAASAAACRALRPSLRSACRAVWLVARSNSHCARWRPTTRGWRMVRRARATATTVGMVVRVRRSERFIVSGSGARSVCLACVYSRASGGPWLWGRP